MKDDYFNSSHYLAKDAYERSIDSSYSEIFNKNSPALYGILYLFRSYSMGIKNDFSEYEPDDKEAMRKVFKNLKITYDSWSAAQSIEEIKNYYEDKVFRDIDTRCLNKIKKYDTYGYELSNLFWMLEEPKRENMFSYKEEKIKKIFDIREKILKDLKKCISKEKFSIEKQKEIFSNLGPRKAVDYIFNLAK